MLSLPGFSLLDWLHVVGLGVAADVFDNLLAYAVRNHLSAGTCLVAGLSKPKDCRNCGCN